MDREEEEVSHGREEGVVEEIAEDGHQGDGSQAAGDSVPAQGRTQGRKVARRKRRVRITRPVELRIGKRRFGVDGWELSAGILTYWIDGVHTLLPVTKKIEIRGDNPSGPGLFAEAMAEAGRSPFARSPEEDKIAKIEREAAEFKRRRSANLSQMMRNPIGNQEQD